MPDEASLPVDPTTDAPPGYAAEQRGVAGGFVGDPDVMDTWATSSLTPQIACGWEDDPDLFAATFPMDLRPQGHEIIRTWLFSTMLALAPGARRRAVAAHDHQRLGPRPRAQEDVQVQGQRGDPACRWWRSSAPTPCATGPATAGPGTDTAVDKGVMKIGRRLAIKILNASKFALGRLGEGVPPGVDAVREPLDLALLAQLAAVVDDGHGVVRAVRLRPRPGGHRDLLLVVLRRLRRAGQDAGLRRGRARPAPTRPGPPWRWPSRCCIRLFAPFLPFVTEEVWSWWQEGSVHRAPWPDVAEIGAHAGRRARRADRGRRGARRGAPREDGPQAVHAGAGGAADRDGPPATLAAVEAARGDITDAGGVDELVVAVGDALSVEVELADEA